jgi:hypothetical protein
MAKDDPKVLARGCPAKAERGTPKLRWVPAIFDRQWSILDGLQS